MRVLDFARIDTEMIINYPFLYLMLHQIFIIYLIAINIIAYLMMITDKLKSKRKGERVSEKSLLVLALVLGSFGILLGMLPPVNHKSSKWN